MSKLLVILGPTSTGKTDLALRLAKKFNGEIISCDSRQVYKGLDIGTGKMPVKFDSLEKEKGKWIIDGIPIYLYDVLDPKRQYNVARFVKDAEEVIKKINKREKLPIIVGGTGLYIRALVNGLPGISIPPNKKLRKELENLNSDQLQEKLKTLSQEKWEMMNYSDRQNPRRVIRSIELASMVLKIGLMAPREILYQRADEKVVSRINQGVVEEARKLRKQGLSFNRMKQLGLEYGVLADYLQGDFDEASLIKILQGKIHGFIRRQLTWFKKEKDVIWFNITDEDFVVKVVKLISKWYDNKNAEKNRHFT